MKRSTLITAGVISVATLVYLGAPLLGISPIVVVVAALGAAVALGLFVAGVI